MRAQGHFQIMFSRQHCPLLQRRLSLFMKLLYCSGVWSYVVGALTTPTYILIPVLTVYAGIFPIVVSWWAAGACCCLCAPCTSSHVSTLARPLGTFHCYSLWLTGKRCIN